LWDDAITGGLLASQIVLSADQINIAGKTIYTSGKTDTIAADAANDATTKANNAQSAAENTAETNRQALINALSQDPTAGHTVIDGGYIKTSLIKADAIKASQGFFDNITVTGLLKSSGIVSTQYIDFNSQRKPPSYEDNIKLFFESLRTRYQLTESQQHYKAIATDCDISIARWDNTQGYIYTYVLYTNTIDIQLTKESPLTMQFTARGIGRNNEDGTIAEIHINIKLTDNDRTAPATYVRYSINNLIFTDAALMTIHLAY
jgi:hypothetical protein